MSNAYFDFKQFRIWHDRCAMKVGTDAVLLGSWAGVGDSRRVLDVGTGSGLIALMVAQRLPQAEVWGIDIDADAVEQAIQNAENSPFFQRVSFKLCDVRNYRDESDFDCVLCNPPFYTEDTLPPDDARAAARNQSSLPFGELTRHVARLLRDGGCFHVILPTSAEAVFSQHCLSAGLFPQRLCIVKTTQRKAPKRVLCTYLKERGDAPLFEELTLWENGRRSEAYSKLTNDFYLDYPQSS